MNYNMKSNDVCRCCLSEVCFKDISNEYLHDGQKEIYSEMLFITFNLNISYQDDSSRLICEDCILRLRDAAAFRTQVERAEEAVVNKLSRSHIYSGLEVIKKLIDYKDEFLDHITGEFDDDDGPVEQYDDEISWHDELVDDSGEVFVIKMEPEDDLSMELEANEIKKKTPKTNIKKEISLKSNKLSRKLPNDIEKPQKTRKRLKSISQIDRKENSLKLINNSNICLFESLKTKFRCFYCKNSYFNITELREHTTVCFLHTHSNQSYLKMCINRLQGMSFKNVDISELMCKLCTKPLLDLIMLRTHLIEQHNIEFSSEEHMLIPYRLNKGFDCVLCDEKYNTFFRLSIHMNTHYTNHVCEICGVSYINRLSLRMHVNSIHKEKKCSICQATFVNTYSRIKHMRKVHNSSEAKRYCLICNKTFRYTYMLNEHKIREHGMKRQVSVCQECGKTFLTPVNLRTHIRSVHIKERNHPCNYCGMSFFTSCDQRRHERTHQDVRLFACSYCDGRFKSKDSLRRHLKRQHGNMYVSHNVPA